MLDHIKNGFPFNDFLDNLNQKYAFGDAKMDTILKKKHKQMLELLSSISSNKQIFIQNKMKTLDYLWID